MPDVALCAPGVYVSTFSGISALDLAIGRVFPDARCCLYVEREIPAVATLAARMASGELDAAPIWSDIRTVPTAHLRGRVDLVVGGFPCQDISSAGKRAGIIGEHSGLFFDLVRAACDLRTRYLFLENVAALTVRGIDTVLGTLSEVGFDAEWGCLRASDVGAPHGRNRWWCLAWDRQQLADTNGHERRSDSRRSDAGPDGRHHPGWCRPDVADAENVDREPKVRLAVDGHALARSGQAVDDTRSQELQQTTDGMVTAGFHRSACAPMDTARGVEHASGPGLEGRRLCRHADPSGRVPYPPGPADRAGWAAYLERYPDLAPAVESPLRRGADGSKARLDRLRGLGNAVVPDQAEWALRLLWHRAFGVFL